MQTWNETDEHCIKIVHFIVFKRKQLFRNSFFIRPLHVRLSNKHVDRFTVVQ